MANLELKPLHSINPTLAELMRVCHLRAALARASGSGQFVLGTPKAWLGTAYHSVLERIAYVDPNEDLEQAVARFWSEAVSFQEQRADAHPLDCRFGKPETWPGYYLARASVQLRAREIGIMPKGKKLQPSIPDSRSREEQFTAYNGKLVGRPDLVRNGEIRDYKSGAITEFSEEAQKEVVKAAYVRQLKIYGFLVGNKLGTYPARGVLVPLGGATVDITLDPHDCEYEAAAALALLDGHNSALNSSSAASALASPSPQSCKWCPFKTLCPAFWENASPAWSGQLEGECIAATLAADPKIIHDGAAMALTVDVSHGTLPAGTVQIAPLNPQVHRSLTMLRSGDRIRIIGLFKRIDGTVTPTQRTVIARVQDLPMLVVKAHSV